MQFVPDMMNISKYNLFMSCWNYVVANLRNLFETAKSLPHNLYAGEEII